MATNIVSYPNLIDDTWKRSSDNTLKEQEQAAADFSILTNTVYVNHG